MKRLILTMVAVLTLGAAANAMSYKSARDQAFFLTDKMAYELGLSDDQYNAVFEINIDYIMCIDTYDDLYGTFWNRRNNELRYVLSAAQYQYYMQLEYFYRPITWTNKKFVFTIYDRYPKDRFYRAAPPGYQVYKGSNRYFDHSAYNGRTFGAPTSKSQPGSGTGTYQPGMGGSKSQPGTSGSKSQPGMTKKQAVNQGKQQMNNPPRR
ncbi:MAG: hypothetical protein IJV05_08600 [Muribaculaceae bacterium]|nr:hypothetical protein [Muribaculaceae bacterium]